MAPKILVRGQSGGVRPSTAGPVSASATEPVPVSVAGPACVPAAEPACAPAAVAATLTPSTRARPTAVLPALTMGLAATLVATLAGCGGPAAQGSGTTRGRTAVPKPDLCEKLDRDLVDDALGGKAEDCATESRPPDEYLTRFSGTGKAPGQKKAEARVAVAYRLRYEPRTGADRWERLGGQQGDKRVKLLSVGDDAVFDYRGGAWPDLAVLKGDLIVLITHDGPASGEELPGLLTALAEGVLAQTG
jgi:hypothetical protein